MLIDEGRVERVGDRWRATAGAADVRVPESIHAVLAARLDSLAADEKRLLQVASIVGERFSAAELRALDPQAETDRILAGLRRKGLVLEDRETRRPSATASSICSSATSRAPLCRRPPTRTLSGPWSASSSRRACAARGSAFSCWRPRSSTRARRAPRSSRRTRWRTAARSYGYMGPIKLYEAAGFREVARLNVPGATPRRVVRYSMDARRR